MPLALLILLAGCAEISAFYTVMKAKGETAADAHYGASKEVYCDTQTSGALYRNLYGTAEWDKFVASCWSGKAPFPKIPAPPKAPDS